MGTKHSTPVASTASTGRSSPASARAPPAIDTSGATAPSVPKAIGPGATATIRPLDVSTRTVTPLDLKITNALRELKRKRSLEDKDNSNPFTRILLKFPLVAQSFNSTRSTFSEFDREGKGYIVYSDVVGAFEKLGVTFSQDEVRQVFQESDMLENGRLNFKEFLVCLAIGFVLHRIPSLESERLSIFYAPIRESGAEGHQNPNPAILFGEGNKLRIAFQLAIDAFLWFDVDGNGTINRNEMASRLQTSTTLHSPTKKTSVRARHRGDPESDESLNAAIWEQRFLEMDWNNDGFIHFKEFLLAFVSWVGLEDEDEDTGRAPASAQAQS